MVTVRRIEVLPYAIPLRTPLVTARGPITGRRGFFILLSADDGLTGVGEAAPHPAEPAAGLVSLQKALGRASSWLVGADLSRVDELLARAWCLGGAAASGIDMALHDLLGRATGRSVADLLGGAVRVIVPTNATLAADSPAAYADAAAAAVSRGFHCAKLKIAPDVATAVAEVAAVRAATPGLVLRADVNGAWDAETAVDAARRLVPYNLEWIEQPVPAADVTGLARVRRSGGVPIAADEAVTGPEAVEQLAAIGAVDAVVLKLAQVGGLARARATARAAAAAGLTVTVTTSLDTAIGTAAALHLASALPGPLRHCGVATGHLLLRDVVRAPIREAPHMAPPAGPGLGISVDEDSLVRCRGEDA